MSRLSVQSAIPWGASVALLAVAPSFAGPFAPPAGQLGSTAIAMNDPSISGWATGYQDIVYGPNVDPTWQTPAKALGPAVGDSFDVVCLGDHGRITLTFAHPITDGTGYDFAVFENAFADSFLELAWVEVSSDGLQFFRFPNHSLTATAVGSYGTIDTTNIDGLAGKYRQGFGTPFDLAQVGLSQASFVRIVDIAGDGLASDSDNHVIFDPYPSMGSGGFDLEAVAVLNVPEPSTLAILVFGPVMLLKGRRICFR